MLSSTLNILWIGFQCCVAFVLVFPVISFFIYAAKTKKVDQTTSPTLNDFAVIVTAYKNSDNLINVINSILRMNYDNYVIYVVADGCPDFNPGFTNEKLVILKPEKEFANQVRSHFFAIENFKRHHNILTIIDSDNLVLPNYLTALNKYFNLGFEAVQGVRKAKNLDTHYACIDAVNELYYLFYDRKILFNIGSSSMLSGSGMAFTVELFKQCLGSSNSSGAGFDKILQKEIVQKGYRIAFAEDAIVLDEKTSNREQIVKQRARWNNTWFRYLSFGFQIMWQGLTQLSSNHLLFGFILTRPPLFLLLIGCFFIFVVNVFISTTAAIIWMVLFGVFIAGFFLALARGDTDIRIYKSLVHIPKFVLLQVLSLARTKKANQYSVATEHSYNQEIEKIT